MAERDKPSEEFLKYFRDYYEKFPLTDPTVNHENACPVIIKFCDASAYARCFSEAIVDFKLAAGIPWSYLFRLGHEELMQYILGRTERRSEAISRLDDFVANIEKHTNCLKCLFSKTERERNGIKNEYQVQVIIAAHVFGPLAGNESCTIGNKGFSKDVRDVRACPVCKQDITAMLGNTSLGNGNAWHGFADIFVKRSIVKVAEEPEGDTNYESERSEASGDIGGPSRKKRRYESCGYESDSVVEVKKVGIDSNAISQGLAQTIVNAYCETPKDHPLQKSFVPSFIVSCQHVRINLYSCGLDWLMMSPDLALFYKEDSNQAPVLDLSTVLSIWYALNFDMYVNHDISEMIPVSKFQRMAGSNLNFYQKHCSKPMEVGDELTPVKFALNDDCLHLLSDNLNRQIKWRKQVKELLKKK